MAKDKSTKKAAAPAKVETVKSGRVAKPAEAPKKAAKVTAKNTANAVEKKKKKSKEPTPEPSSESESESDAATSASSDSSDSESEEEVAAPKTNGAKAKAAKKAESDSEDSSASDDSESESEAEAAPAKAAAPKTNGVNGKAKAEDSDDSDSESEEEDEDTEEPAKASKDTDSSDSEEEDEASDSDSSSDEEEKAKPAVEEKSNKKRKADSAVEATPKRAKVMVDGEEKEPVANLFIGQLSWNIDEEWLTREFEGFGEIAGVRIITDRDSGRSKGYGYVEFVNVDDAVKALEEMTGKELDGRNIRVDFSAPRQSRDSNNTPQQRSFDRAQKYGDQPKEPTTTLWVGNISFDADENTLTEAFQPYGAIKAIRLPTDRDTGAPKGFGYIEMESLDDAKSAFASCQGMEVAGRALRLDYAGERSNDSPGGGRGGFGGGRGGGGFGGGRGGGRGRGGSFGGGRGGGGRGGFGGRGGKPSGTNRGGFGDFSGKKTTF